VRQPPGIDVGIAGLLGSFAGAARLGCAHYSTIRAMQGPSTIAVRGSTMSDKTALPVRVRPRAGAVAGAVLLYRENGGPMWCFQAAPPLRGHRVTGRALPGDLQRAGYNPTARKRCQGYM
jgi:hypothetical protein